MSLLDEGKRKDREQELAKKGADPAFATLEELVANLHATGIDFRVVDGKVQILQHSEEQADAFRFDIGQEHIRLGVVSDTHGGSHYEQQSALKAFYAYADGTGPHPSDGSDVGQPVDAFLHCGDWTQGADKMHLDQPYQVHAHGADQQGEYVVQTYPRSVRPGVKTFGIGGNHDDSFLKDGGVNIVRRIAAKREDIEYLGSPSRYFSVGSANMYLIHPRGGMPYAKSYRLQKINEQLPVGRQIVLNLMGHLHSYALTQDHGVTGIMVPCFQSQYGWMASGGLHPEIGGIILDIWLRDDGGVGRIRHELVRFERRERDWDHAVSHEVQAAFSPDGPTEG